MATRSRQDAIKALVVGGKAAEARKVIEEHAGRAASRYRAIEADESLSEKGRRHQLAAAYTSVSTSLNDKLQQMASGVVSIDRDDAECVFGIKGLPGDVASLTISRRDAADRVAAIEDRAELRDLLARATRSGDEVLARAVAERAVRMGDAKTMHQFVADRPSLEAASERLWNAEQAGAGTFQVTAGLVGLKPDELMGMHDESIAELASSPPNEPAPEPAFEQATGGGYFG